jgi:hypothetical protein
MSPTDFYNIIYALPRGQSGFPTKKAMSEATGLNIWNVKLFLKGLVKSGKIRMEGNWYKFNEERLKEIIVTDKQAKDYLVAITEENKHDSIEAYPIKNKIESFTILRFSMGIIGISSGVMSAYYTQIWQHETLNIFWSWFLSLIMIGFSFTAFLTLIGILTKKLKNDWKNIAIAIVFTFLWIICLIYSVQVTVAGRYSQYQEIVLNNQVKENDQNINKVRINNLLSSIDSLKADKLNNQKQLDILLNQYDYAQVGMEIKGNSLAGIKKDIETIKGTLSIINNKLENKSLEYEKTLSSSNIINSNEKKFGVYDWLAKIYKTDRSNIEWWFLLFPSLFLDIASPIALAVFMFLGNKNKAT